MKKKAIAVCETNESNLVREAPMGKVLIFSGAVMNVHPLHDDAFQYIL